MCYSVTPPRHHHRACFLVFLIQQATSAAIKEGDEVRYTASGEGAKEERAKVVKVHHDVEGAHYTIRMMGKDGKEKNTDASHVSKVSFKGGAWGGGGSGVQMYWLYRGENLL